MTSTPKNIQISYSNTNLVDTENESNLLFGNVSDVEYHKLCAETYVSSSSSSYTDTVISKYVIRMLYVYMYLNIKLIFKNNRNIVDILRFLYILNIPIWHNICNLNLLIKYYIFKCTNNIGKTIKRIIYIFILFTFLYYYYLGIALVVELSI